MKNVSINVGESGKLKRAKKRNRLSIFQKFEAFELALIVDGALQGEDLDCVKCGMKEQRELINRTRLALTTLCLPKGLNRVKQEKLNMVRCILMEFHVKQVRTDPTYSFDVTSSFCCFLKCLWTRKQNKGENLR